MHEEIAKVHSVAQKFPQERRDFTDKGLENTLKGLTPHQVPEDTSRGSRLTVSILAFGLAMEDIR